MEITLMHYLIICPLIGIAGYVDSIAGGGGLITLPAFLITGLPVHTCIATNKVSSSMGITVSIAKYASAGFIDWHIGVFCAAASLIGASLGANIALLISESAFRMLMLIILPLTALYVLRKKNLFSGEERKDLPFAFTVLLSSVIAFALGMYDGFYGPGTGTFLILLLTRFAHMDVQHANGITKVINCASNYAALAVYLINGQALLPLGICAGVFSIIGNYLGSRSFTKKGAAIARPLILFVLTLFFARTVLEMLGVM